MDINDYWEHLLTMYIIYVVKRREAKRGKELRELQQQAARLVVDLERDEVALLQIQEWIAVALPLEHFGKIDALQARLTLIRERFGDQRSRVDTGLSWLRGLLS